MRRRIILHMYGNNLYLQILLRETIYTTSCFVMSDSEDEYPSLIASGELVALKNFRIRGIHDVKDSSMIDTKRYHILDRGVWYAINVFTMDDAGKSMHASLVEVKDKGENKTIFPVNNDSDSIDIDFDDDTITIMRVNIETKGICTRSVAYTMKALLHYINNKNHFAPKGMVSIVSKNPIRAFNCYRRAFKLNGYEMNDGEYEEFEKKYYDAVVTDKVDEVWKKNFEHGFDQFVNYEQKRMWQGAQNDKEQVKLYAGLKF